jgi:hypothetical protein
MKTHDSCSVRYLNSFSYLHFVTRTQDDQSRIHPSQGIKCSLAYGSKLLPLSTALSIFYWNIWFLCVFILMGVQFCIQKDKNVFFFRNICVTNWNVFSKRVRVFQKAICRQKKNNLKDNLKSKNILIPILMCVDKFSIYDSETFMYLICKKRRIADLLSSVKC